MQSLYRSLCSKLYFLFFIFLFSIQNLTNLWLIRVWTCVSVCDYRMVFRITQRSHRSNNGVDGLSYRKRITQQSVYSNPLLPHCPLHDDVINFISHLKEFQDFLNAIYGHTSCRIISNFGIAKHISCASCSIWQEGYAVMW